MLRDQEAYELYQTGLTYQEVGEKMGISRERARQLIVHFERYRDNEIYNFIAPRFDSAFTGTTVNRLAGANIRTIKALKQELKDNKVLGPITAEALRKALEDSGL